MSDRSADGELLNRACRGDESAFLCIYEQHRGRIFRFAYRMLGSTTAAEDITHECFLSLLRKPQRFDPGRASLRTYLYGAARHLAWMHRHKTALELEKSNRNGNSSPEHTPFDKFAASEISEAVRLAIASLPPLQREAIILFEFEEISLSEIAVIADTDIGTIKSRLHRARQNLRTLLAKWHSAGECTGVKDKKP
jgi:RNA polymerase sigma-70 factor, ECF subfamily